MSQFIVSELQKALFEARKKFPKIEKNGVNPYYKSEAHPKGSPFMIYEDILEGILPPLAEEGIYPQHESGFYNAGQQDLYWVGTRFVHVPSGELGEIFKMPVPIDVPQKTSGGITYARRVTLAGLAGIAADYDDDGNSASTKKDGKEIYDGSDDQKPIFRSLAKVHGIVTDADLKKLSEVIIKLKSPMNKLGHTISEYLINPYMENLP